MPILIKNTLTVVFHYRQYVMRRRISLSHNLICWHSYSSGVVAAVVVVVVVVVVAVILLVVVVVVAVILVAVALCSSNVHWP